FPYTVLFRAGCGPDEADAADVDLFDDLIFGTAGGHGGFEGVQVHDHQVDGRDGVLLQLGHVAGQPAPPQDPAEDLRMEGLHAAPEDARVVGEGFNGGHGHAQAGDEVLGATGGEDVDAQPVQLTNDGLQPILVEHGDQGAMNANAAFQMRVGLLPWNGAQF